MRPHKSRVLLCTLLRSILGRVRCLRTIGTIGALILGLLECAATVGTQHALHGLESLPARLTKPAAHRDVLDAVTRLVDADVTVVTENHLICFFAIRLK